MDNIPGFPGKIIENLPLAPLTTWKIGGPAIVLEATFFLGIPDKPPEINSRMQKILSERRAKFPLNLPNCGSVFKSLSQGIATGRIIEQTGLKGTRIGDGQISQKHANFIVNLGHATLQDVKALIGYVQEKVLKSSGIVLEREVIYTPEEGANWNK